MTFKTIHRTMLAAAISALGLGAVGAAHANTYNVAIDGAADYSDYGPAEGTPVSAALVITTEGTSTDSAKVTGISGTVFGQTVTGLNDASAYWWTSSANYFSGTGDHVNAFGVLFDSGSESWRLLGHGGGYWELQNNTNDWDVVNVTMTVTQVSAPVPEPETYAMLLAGLGVLGAVARRRQRDPRALSA